MVSPAHAGIDLLRRDIAPRLPCLPRACGDRPLDHEVFVALWLSPPRMRGSTHLPSHQSTCDCVSPAHAGIDLIYIYSVPLQSRLPRACGDRPCERIRDLMRQSSPPRMRGSTCIIEAVGYAHSVSPAHAGIDLTG